AKARLPTSLWLKIKKDLDLMGEAHSRTEWEQLRALFMQKWKEGRDDDLQRAHQDAISRFLNEFSGYLDPSSWRSRWSRSCSEICGPRTNNAVERFNKELKQ
ncbi:hypothetical protein FOL47_005016, partial [Perkinsus chesapeaki]